VFGEYTIAVSLGVTHIPVFTSGGGLVFGFNRNKIVMCAVGDHSTDAGPEREKRESMFT
jgi:hypothetical protein